MRRLLLTCLSLLAAAQGYSQPAVWAKKINYFATESVVAMTYVPDVAGTGASLWTHTMGELPSPPGGSSISTFENRLMAFRESNGTPLFNKLVNWGSVMGMTYDSSSDEVVIVLGGVSNNPLARVSIGTDTFKIVPDQVPPTPPCDKIAVVRYGRTGTLNGYALLDYPCTEDGVLDYAYGTVCAINTIQNRVALSFQAYGKLFPPINTMTFAGQSRQVSADSGYVTVFEWDYQGNQLHMNMFAQDRNFAVKSRAENMTYDDADNIYLAGELKSDIDFGTVLVNRGTDVAPTFLARIRPDGTVAAARRIQAGPLGGLINDMTFSAASQQLYVAGSWRNQLTLDGSPVVTNWDSSWQASMYVVAMDSTLAIQHMTVLRDGDTVNANTGTMQLVNLTVDSRGHLLASGGFTDSLYVNNTVIRARSTFNPQFDPTDVLVVDFTDVLQLDTMYVSEGSGSEIAHKIVAGKPKEMYIGGSFAGPCSFPPYSFTSTPSPASWVIDAFYTRLKWQNNPTGVATVKDEPATLYPNPASTTVRIELHDLRQIRITTPDGRIIEQKDMSAGTSVYSLQVADWAAGLYMVQITDGKGTLHSSKLIKQ